jgi:hypothetical protein
MKYAIGEYAIREQASWELEDRSWEHENREHTSRGNMVKSGEHSFWVNLERKH